MARKADQSRQEQAPTSPARGLYKPTPRECALLLLRLVEAKGQEGTEGEPKKEMSRIRFSEIALKRIWGRRRISPEMAEEVGEWLASAGWTLFFAGAGYGMIRTSVVESWARVSSKRLSSELQEVAKGAFDFSKLEHLLPVPSEEDGEEDERDQRPKRH